MGKIYERPKLVIIGVDNIDVIAALGSGLLLGRRRRKE